MPRRRLGAEGPELSVVGLGGWQAGGGRTWGRNRDDREVVDALRHGWDCGANWIDTAEVYAQGGSEELIGRALRGRDEVAVMTKVGPRPDGSGMRAEEIEAAAEGSLARLGRDHIDVYLIHWRDPDIPLEESWGAMAELTRRGLVRHAGLSNVSVADLELCAAIRRVDALQLQASLLYREELEAMAPVCRRLGTGIVCYGPLAFGLLSGSFGGPTRDWRAGGGQSEDFFVVENHERFFSTAVLPEHLRRAARLTEVAASFGITPSQAALAWLLAQPGVTGAIAGSRSPRHFEENLRAAALAPGAAELAAIERAVAG